MDLGGEGTSKVGCSMKNSSKIRIDTNAGFCFGVEKAIQKAEQYLNENGTLYCLGEMVHNEAEVERLKSLGLITIDKETFKKLKNTTVLLRAHGEPPDTYEIAEKNNLTLIDATCPLVIRLQKKVKRSSETGDEIVIYGNKTHPEVIGLAGQNPDKTKIIENEDELEKLESSGSIQLFSQTTKSLGKYLKIREKLERNLSKIPSSKIIFNNSICKQVHNRNDNLKIFCKQNDVILFVGGKKSSNARVLFDICKNANENSYFVSSPEDIEKEWIDKKETIGISGATSTPAWLLEDVKNYIKEMFS